MKSARINNITVHKDKMHHGPDVEDPWVEFAMFGDKGDVTRRPSAGRNKPLQIKTWDKQRRAKRRGKKAEFAAKENGEHTQKPKYQSGWFGWFTKKPEMCSIAHFSVRSESELLSQNITDSILLSDDDIEFEGHDGEDGRDQGDLADEKL